MPAKYHNVKTELDGYKFDSLAERARYEELKLMLKGGAIAGLAVHFAFPLHVDKKLVAKYVADFFYHDIAKDCKVIEDVKGVRTAVYRLKKKMVKSQYGIDITEVEA